jgi:hypothetical protein
MPILTKSLYEHYLDTSVPFGHELVLATMLTISDPEERPWRKFQKEYPDLYRSF